MSIFWPFRKPIDGPETTVQSKAMRWRIISFTCALVALIVAFFCYLWLTGLGFPDGYISDLDRALRWLYRFFAVLNLIFALWLFHASFRSSREALKSRILTAAAFYLAGAGLTVIVHYALCLRLDAGAGG